MDLNRIRHIVPMNEMAMV